jgi:hypothetical protein
MGAYSRGVHTPTAHTAWNRSNLRCAQSATGLDTENEKNKTMKTDTYNGWTNRETWLVNVWSMPEGIDRNQSVDDIKAELRAKVRDILEFEFPENVSGLVADFLPGVDDIMREINFSELAEAHCELEDDDDE